MTIRICALLSIQSTTIYQELLLLAILIFEKQVEMIYSLIFIIYETMFLSGYEHKNAKFP
jgi:hypothetical protein